MLIAIGEKIGPNINIAGVESITIPTISSIPAVTSINTVWFSKNLPIKLSICTGI